MNDAEPLDWLADASEHVWQPYTQMRGAPEPLAVVRGEGVWLYTADGRRILDGISSWWVNIHGHAHPRLGAALARQAAILEHVVFAGVTHEPGARLAAELAARVPGELPHVFYSDDGSTSVEAALKMAYQYQRFRGEPQRNTFVSIAGGYHGDTIGAMAVSDVREFRDEFAGLLFPTLRVAGPEGGEHPPLAQVLQREGERIAAVIIEPMVQGAGGMRIWPAAFLRELRELTRQSGTLLIADEVFTGFGRTGRMFACEHGPVEPDIICVSKALTGGYLPLAATLASREVYDAFLSDDRGRAFFHGHSYTGNALACAVALESLSIFDEEDRLGRVLELEALFARRLANLTDHPLVARTRGIGGIAVLELEPESRAGYLDDRGRRVVAICLERGLLLRPLGNVLYFLPPYVITDEEVHEAFDTIGAALDAVGTRDS